MTRHIGISVPHRRVDDDDDIQDYKKPWVGLTDEEIENAYIRTKDFVDMARVLEDILKEKNNG